MVAGDLPQKVALRWWGSLQIRREWEVEEKEGITLLGKSPLGNWLKSPEGPWEAVGVTGWVI
jgi:hypothetical protein